MRAPTRARPSELAYSWPAIPFALAIVFGLVHALGGAEWTATVGLLLVGGAFFPCCLIRDAWVRRYPPPYGRGEPR